MRHTREGAVCIGVIEFFIARACVSCCIGLKFVFEKNIRVIFERGRKINISQNGKISVFEKINMLLDKFIVGSSFQIQSNFEAKEWCIQL